MQRAGGDGGVMQRAGSGDGIRESRHVSRQHSRKSRLIARAHDLMENNRISDALELTEHAILRYPESAEVLACYGAACFLKALHSRAERRCLYMRRAAEAFCVAHEKDSSLVDAELFCKLPVGQCYQALRTFTPGWAEMNEEPRQCTIDQWRKALQSLSSRQAQVEQEEADSQVAALEQQLRVEREQHHLASCRSLASMQMGVLLLCGVAAATCRTLALSDPASTSPLSMANFACLFSFAACSLAAASQVCGERGLAWLWEGCFLVLPLIRFASVFCMGLPSLRSFLTDREIYMSYSRIIWFGIGMMHSTVALSSRTKLLSALFAMAVLILGLSALVTWRTSAGTFSKDTLLTWDHTLVQELRIRASHILLPFILGYLTGHRGTHVQPFVPLTIRRRLLENCNADGAGIGACIGAGRLSRLMTSVRQVCSWDSWRRQAHLESIGAAAPTLELGADPTVELGGSGDNSRERLTVEIA